MYSSMKGIHLGMTLFPLYKSALAFPALEKYYPLFFLALAPVTARPFEYSSSVPCGAQEWEKSISLSKMGAGNSIIEYPRTIIVARLHKIAV